MKKISKNRLWKVLRAKVPFIPRFFFKSCGKHIETPDNPMHAHVDFKHEIAYQEKISNAEDLWKLVAYRFSKKETTS